MTKFARLSDNAYVAVRTFFYNFEREGRHLMLQERYLHLYTQNLTTPTRSIWKYSTTI